MQGKFAGHASLRLARNVIHLVNGQTYFSLDLARPIKFPPG